ncbi:MAG: site-specific integrase [Chloroflexi bacterium]|nr:MAG: site-specific integrase [Chloroflexota bacterium]
MNSLTLSPSTFDYSALDRADLAHGTLRHYKAAIALLIASNINPFDYHQLADYAAALPSSGRSNLKAALAIITRDYVNQVKAGATVDNHAAVQAFLWKIDAMNEAITITQPDSQRQPHWLSQSQVDQITSLALSRSMRDYIVLATLLGAGLRREEMETLTFDSLRQIPNQNTLLDVLVIHGKGDKKRVVRISSLLASHLREWKAITGGGRVARSLDKTGALGSSLSAVGIFSIVRKYGALLGIPNLDPHDLRRSYGRLMYEATGDIILVMSLLGHSSVRTTQKYIGLDIRLDIDEAAFPVGDRDYVMKVSGD